MRYVRLSEVLLEVSLKKPTIYKLIQKGEFPRPIKIGRSSLWSMDEISEFLNNKMKSRKTK